MIRARLSYLRIDEPVPRVGDSRMLVASAPTLVVIDGITEALTVIEPGPQLMSREDPDVADEVQRILSDEGTQFLLAAEALHVDGRSGEEVSLVVRTTSGEQRIGGSDILVAAGRTPNTAGIGLEEAGVALDERGSFASTSGWRRVRPRSGPSGTAPAARSSRTYPSTTFGS